MELWKKQKKIGAAFCIFLSLMFLCTLISRAVYASKLPQITTRKPERTSLIHRVEAEGLVQQGREYAVNTLSGLRCSTVHAHVGDRVTTETLLFEIDMEDLEEQIREQEIAIQKLTLTIQEQEQNKNLDAGQKKTEQDRAREDYDRAAETAKSNVDRAKEDLRGAQDALESLRQNPAGVTSEEDRKKAQAEYEAWTAKEQELQKALTEAQAEKQSAEEDLKKTGRSPRTGRRYRCPKAGRSPKKSRGSRKSISRSPVRLRGPHRQSHKQARLQPGGRRKSRLGRKRKRPGKQHRSRRAKP